MNYDETSRIQALAHEAALTYFNQALGHFQQAQETYQEALSHYTALGYRQDEAMVLQDLGD